MEQKVMKALVYHEPGKYSLTDVPVPQIVEPTDVIGKVTLAAICTSDIHQVHGHMPSPYPKVIGHEFCIEVIEVGSAVKKLKPGDRCFVIPAWMCGECIPCKLGFGQNCVHGGVYGGMGSLEGAHAEYIRVLDADNYAILIPPGLTEEDVILVPDILATAWFGCKNAEVSEGKTVAVIGVGPVGQCAAMLAKKSFGAKLVIGVDIQQYRLDAAMNNGNLDFAISDPDSEEVKKKIMELTNGIGVDTVIETGGNKATMDIALCAAKMGGTVSTVAIIGQPFEIDWNQMVWKNLQLRAGIQCCEGVPEMLGMIMEGQINTTYMLTHRAPLNDIMKGYEVFGKQQDGCIKWLITPYER